MADGGASRALTGASWLVLYGIVALAPLVIALSANPPPGRGFWLEFSVALGFVGLSMMGLQFAVVGRFRALNTPFGLDAVLQFHRLVSFVAFAFVLAHPVIIVLDRPALRDLLNPVTAHWTARFGLISVGALVVLILTSLWRTRFGLSYEAWRVLHGLLAVIVVATALVHIGRVGYYVDGPIKRGSWVLMSLVFIALLVNIRILTPVRIMRRPWKVASVESQPGQVWTLRLVPDGHDGLSFLPGQFAWIRINRSPFSVHEHPFSFSSSAEARDQIEFGIREAGDMTSQIGSVEPGSKVYLDGPYGVFSTERHQGPAFVFAAGGIGISPILSMLRTLADRGDPRPVVLLFANQSWADTPYREELDQLADRLDLRITYLVETAEGAPTERDDLRVGMIDEETIDECVAAELGDHWRRARFLICGPPPMMSAVESLLDERGVPQSHIDHERFDIMP